MFYQAIMRAADHIDQHPGLFDFHVSWVPECGSPGCALGWIGFFAGFAPTVVSDVADRMGTNDWEFYRRLDALVGDDWNELPHTCAYGLRLYAEKYYGHERQVEELKASLQSLPETEVT